MTHRPYPNRDRALRQVQRHDDEWTPGGPTPPPVKLPASFLHGPVLPAKVKLGAVQVQALREFSEQAQRAGEGVQRAMLNFGTALSHVNAARSTE